MIKLFTCVPFSSYHFCTTCLYRSILKYNLTINTITTFTDILTYTTSIPVLTGPPAPSLCNLSTSKAAPSHLALNLAHLKKTSIAQHMRTKLTVTTHFCHKKHTRSPSRNRNNYFQLRMRGYTSHL